MRLTFFGSGAFGLPTLDRLRREHDLALVVSQPDRPAGRRRALTPTPVAAFARDHGLELVTPEDPNTTEAISRVQGVAADAFVVIAYGHKLGAPILDEIFAVNLHASLLPKYRGAAPINRAMMSGETHTGVSVILLAQQMDGGAVVTSRSTRIDPHETAGELHDRLADLGPEAILEVLDAHRRGTVMPVEQDAVAATRAPKLSKDEGRVRFDQPAECVRAIVHGLTPWPGCTVRIGEERLKLLRVEVVETDALCEPGIVDEQGLVHCAPGAVHLLSVQPAGGKTMTFDAYRRGRRLAAGTRLEAPA